VGRKKPLPILENITIQGVAAEGKAIARYNDMVVFVPFVVPGDVVDLQVTKKRKNHMEAKVVKHHQFSANRLKPFCEHFGVCGGCKWQVLPYEEQLKHKQQEVIDALTRIGKLQLPESEPILGSPKTQFYRNKLEYTFSQHRWLSREEMGTETPEMNALGFHVPGLFDKILDIKKCYLQSEPSNQIRLAVKDFTLKQGYAYYNQRTNLGFLRNIVIRTVSTGEVMVLVIFGEKRADEIAEVMNYIDQQFGEIITSLQYIVNTKVNDTYSDLEVVLFKGREFIYEQMEELSFKIGPKSFYQTNSEQAYRMYSIIREYAQLSGNEVVYDLYSGTGTIACFLANKASKVIGIEYVKEAVDDAHLNAQLNKIEHAQFFSGDMKDVLNEAFIQQHGRPDVIITDPPRAGMHPNVIVAIKYCQPKRIVYVSCNPATQARDLELLKDNYQIIKVQPIDMFPHTHHVENIVLLGKTND
jgi:23S rRNA (uracil1939-C5)-methyltransferase